MDQATVIALIRQLHRERNFMMEQRKRADLALGAFLRQALGWSKDLPDADRKRINSHALALIKMGEAEALIGQLEAKGDLIRATERRALERARAVVSTDDSAYGRCRRVIVPTLAARAPFNEFETQATENMEALAKQLPAWSKVSGIRGFSARALAVIVGEAGDLADYPTHSKLWKRMGLAVIGGIRQGGLGDGASKQDWIDHGYNKARRSRVFVIGDVLVKIGDKYRDIYLKRKEYERARAEAAGKKVVPAAKIPKGGSPTMMSEGHVHRRAQRYMEKRLLRDLWRAWNAGSEGHGSCADEAIAQLPSSPLRSAA